MSERVDKIMETMTDASKNEVQNLILYLKGSPVFVLGGVRGRAVAQLVPMLSDVERQELLSRLGDDEGGLSGVREPRRPRPPQSGSAGAIADIEYEAEEELERHQRIAMTDDVIPVSDVPAFGVQWRFAKETIKDMLIQWRKKYD